MILAIFISCIQQKQLLQSEAYGFGALDYRGDIPLNRIASNTDLSSPGYKFYIAGRYQEAADAALDYLEEKPDSTFALKLTIDSMRRSHSASEIQKKIVKALFRKGKASLRGEGGSIGACYTSVVLGELSKLDHSKLDEALSSQLGSVADFGKAKFTGNLALDLIVASFGTHSMSQEVRSILKKDMVAYPNEPFFFACAVEEFTAGYKEGQEVGFRPGWGPDWSFVEKVCDSSINKWPAYPSFYLYKGLALKRRKDHLGAISMLSKYRDLIKSRGGTRLYNTNLVIDQLRKLG